MHDLFEQAKKNAPCIIFLDEIDAIGRTRSGASAIAGNEEVLEREQVLAIVHGAQNTQGGASSEKAAQNTLIPGS